MVHMHGYIVLECEWSLVAVRKTSIEDFHVEYHHRMSVEVKIKSFFEISSFHKDVSKTLRTRGGALGRVQNLRRQYCSVTQVNLISYSFNLTSTVLTEL